MTYPHSCAYLLLDEKQRAILTGLVDRLRSCAIRETDRRKRETWWWTLIQCEHVLAGRTCSFFHSGDDAIARASALLTGP